MVILVAFIEVDVNKYAIVLDSEFSQNQVKEREKKTFKAIILIKFQMRNIDKIVELPFFCLKRITPKESDFFILGSVVQVLLLVSFNAAGLGSKLQL